MHEHEENVVSKVCHHCKGMCVLENNEGQYSTTVSSRCLFCGRVQFWKTILHKESYRGVPQEHTDEECIEMIIDIATSDPTRNAEDAYKLIKHLELPITEELYLQTLKDFDMNTISKRRKYIKENLDCEI